MKSTRAGFFLVLLMSLVTIASSIVNDSSYLIVEPGESITLSGVVHKKVSILVKDGGVVNIKPYDGAGIDIGKLNLISPVIIIYGEINGEAVGHNESGKGGAPFQAGNGGGGGGYGGSGGDGHYEGSGSAGLGGIAFDILYEASEGSYGWNAGYISQYSGYGGAGLRLDAIDLNIGSSAIINLNGSQSEIKTVGGGSGGSLILDGLTTTLQFGCVIELSGGEAGRKELDVGAAGGGGGGRFKGLSRVEFTNSGATILVMGGGGGGDTAKDGSIGIIDISTFLPGPDSPVLLNPGNHTIAGLNPTFQFVTHDDTDFKFLKYQIFISEDINFLTIEHTSSQLDSDVGWGGRTYYASDEIAGYALPLSLKKDTPYYWSVSVTADNGMTWLDASTHFDFETTDSSNSIPLKPQILFPANGNINIIKTPLLSVLAADPEGDTLTGQILISQDQLLANPQVFKKNYAGWDQEFYVPSGTFAGITATCQILNVDPNFDALDPGITYYCQVAVFDHLQQSNSSDIISFVTVARPEVPVIFAPTNQSVISSKLPSIQFSTSSPTNSNLKYELELSSNNFQTILVFKSEAGGGWLKTVYLSGEIATLTIPDENTLIPGITYSWRVKAYDIDNDNWSAVSENYQFTVITPPLVPELIYPDNNYIAPDSRLTFRFKSESESANTLTAKVELSDNNFLTILKTFDQQTDQMGWDKTYYYSNSIAAFSIPETFVFERNKNYYWRVTFFNGYSWSSYSEIRILSLASSLSLTLLKTFPNPAVNTNILNIYFQLSVDAEITCSLYNKLGKEVGQLRTYAKGGSSGNTLEIDISNYSSGIYYYILESKSEFGTTKSIKRFAIVK